MSPTLTPLEWDTGFFGVRIARATGDDLHAIAAEATVRGIACVYIESARVMTAEGLDLRLTDRRVVLERPATTTTGEMPVRTATASDIAAVDPLLERLAPWSRFARDPGFGVTAAQRMYRAWLERASARDDEWVGVAELDSAIAGFVTVALGSPAEIGLISVAQEGFGVGSALVCGAAHRSAPAALRVATQADNERALALYERNDFRRVSESHVYHLWLEDNERRG